MSFNIYTKACQFCQAFFIIFLFKIRYVKYVVLTIVCSKINPDNILDKIF